MTIHLPEIENMAVAVDTECSGLHPDDGATVSVVSIAYIDPDLDVLVAEAYPFDQGKMSSKPDCQPQLFEPECNLPEEDWIELLEWLSRQRLIFHNAKYDLTMLDAGTRHWKGRDLSDRLVWDCLLVNKHLDPLEEAALKASAERLGLAGDDVRRFEKQLKKIMPKVNGQPRYDLVDWSVMEPYALKDAEITRLLRDDQAMRLDEGLGDSTIVERELDVCLTLFRMEQRGIGWNRQRADEAALVIETEIQRIKALLPFRPTIEAAKHYWFVERGMLPYDVTPTGKPKLDKDVLRRMVDQGIEFAAEWSALSKLEKMNSMWYRGWSTLCGEDGRLRTVYHQTKATDDAGKERGAVSGRFSVERLQLQAIPHDYQLVIGDLDIPTVRELFEAKPDHELWEIDLSQAEVRVASHIAKCTPMIDGIQAGDDSHSIATRRTFGIDEGHPEWDFHRAVGKRLNFAMLYGAGVDTVQQQILFFTGRLVDKATVQRWVRDYRNTFPQFPRTSRRAESSAIKNGYVRLIGGAQRWFKPFEDKHKAFNAVIQGGVAELVKMWMVEVDQTYPGALLLQIHDSLVLELPKKGAAKTAKHVARMGEVICEEHCPSIPFVADVKKWGDK